MRTEIAHHQRIFGECRKALGSEQVDVRAFANNLANGYVALRRTAAAVQLDEETLAVRERVLGPEYPGTLQSRNNLASGYRVAGREDDARRLEAGE